MQKRSGLFTAKQLLVLVLHDKFNLGFSEIAKILNTTRQDAAAAYRRAHANLKAAKQTVLTYTLAISELVFVDRGENVDDLIKRLLEAANRRGIRLRWGRRELHIVLRGLLQEYIEEDKISRRVVVAIGRNGVIDVFDFEEVIPILEVIEKLIRSHMKFSEV